MKTIIGNWKMNVGIRESVALARGTLLTLRGRKMIPELIICPPFVALSEVRKVVARSHASLCAQNFSWEEQGAMTGEISARMLEELNVSHVIIGHSERRHKLGETDEMVNKKLIQALSHSFVPIVCIGETKEERASGSAREIIQHQLATAFSSVRLKSSDRLFVAYEPVWAIGTGDTAEVSEVLEMHEFVRSIIESLFPNLEADQLKILYGGSVDGENAYSFLREAVVDGVLVGGASVKLNKFKEIISAASEVLEAQTS